MQPNDGQQRAVKVAVGTWSQSGNAIDVGIGGGGGRRGDDDDDDDDEERGGEGEGGPQQAQQAAGSTPQDDETDGAATTKRTANTAARQKTNSSSSSSSSDRRRSRGAHNNVPTSTGHFYSPFTDIEPPGPDVFTQWFAGELLANDEDQAELGIRDDGGRSSSSSPQLLRRLSNNADVEIGVGAGRDVILGSPGDGGNDNDNADNCKGNDDPIRKFMGPSKDDNVLLNELRQRRRDKLVVDDTTGSYRINSRNDILPYDTVSYKLLDTPVWHNYTLCLGNRRRRRWVTRIRRYLCTCPRSWFTNYNPIRTYQMDTQFVTRIVLIAIGLIMSVGGFAVAVGANKLLVAKINYATEPTLDSEAFTEPFLTGFTRFVLLNLLFGLLAFLPVGYYRPVSAGSGIAEAKAILNGIILPCCTELRTALSKAISIIFASSASLPVGLEGPMIFMGLAIGENSQRFISNDFASLKTDRYRRDFAVVGTASGVTSAFFSPIGGVLFAMEEGSSFWSPVLAWQSFGVACVTIIFSYAWVSCISRSFGRLDVDNLSKYSGLAGQEQIDITFHLWDYFVFAMMGGIGGIFGAGWCECNLKLAVWRNKLDLKRHWKLVEVLVLVCISSSLMWWLPQVLFVCGKLDTAQADDKFFRQFGCAEGQYNQLATLLLNPPSEVGLNLLFWEPADVFRADTCIVAGAIYFIMLLLLFGTPISMGIFIPLLYVGACYGRALGIWWDLDTAVTSTYACVGSVAMLGGVVRVLISITIIMVTTTGLPYLITPFMVAAIMARVTGKAIFGKDGIYDLILHLKGIPFLEADPPAQVLFRGLRAQDIMSTFLVTLEPEQQVGRLLDVVIKYPFPDFPVIDPSRGGAFIGIITRADILTILGYKELFYDRGDNSYINNNNNQASHRRRRKALRHEELIHRHYGEPTLGSLADKITECDRTMVIDLTPYIEIAHYTFDRLGSVERAYEIFRTLGLRQLVVTGPKGIPVGVITRYDLRLLEEVDGHNDDKDKKRKNVRNNSDEPRRSVDTYDSLS